MAIVRLALANPPANTNTLLHTANRQSLVSLIVTNTASSTAEIDIWVVPQGEVSASGYAYMAKGTLLPVKNSLETFRFSLQNNDSIYIRSSINNISFSLNGIHDSSGNYNKVTVSSTAPNNSTIGDVWISPSASTVSFWNDSNWSMAVNNISSGVASINGQTGVVTGIAPINSPSFTGTPIAPTAPVDTNTTQVATTAYVINQGYAKVESTNLTGTPTAPNAAYDDDSTQIATTAYVQDAIERVTINTKTSSYTLALGDAGEVVEMNSATANTLTVPLNSTVAFPIGTRLDIVQYGAGQTTFAGEAGVTIRSKGNNLKLTGQYSAASLYKRDTNEWVLIGDLAS